MTDSFVKHALEVLDRQLATTVTTVTTDGDSVDNNNTATFRFQLLAHHSHLKKMLRAMRQSSVDDRLLSEFRIVEAVREQLLESRSHDGLVTNGGNRLSMAASMEALAQVVMGCAADSSNGNDGGAGMSAEGRGRARAIPLSVTRVSGASIATGATGGTTTSGDGSDEERGDDDDDDEDGTTTAEQRRHRGGSTSVNHPRTTMPMAINTTIAASRTAATQFGTPVPDPSLSETSFHRAMTGVNAHCDAHSHAVAAKETATSFLPARILAAHVRKKCTSTTTVSSVVSPLSPGSGDAATTGEELAGIVETWLNVSQLSVRPPNSG